MQKKVFNKKTGIVCAVVAAILVLVGSLAYFTDYAAISAEGTAGTVAIALDSKIDLLNDEGKDILNPGDMRDAGFDVTNMGNKSIDVRETIALSAVDYEGNAISFTGDASTQSEFDLYLRSDVEEVTGEGYKPLAGATPLQVKSIDGNVITYTLPEYILNGNSDEYDEVETVDGVDAFVKSNDFVLVFKGEAGNEWQGAKVSMDVLVEAKQHENTSAGWDIVAQEQVSQGVISKDAVLAETVITDGTAQSVFIPVTSVDQNGNDLNATSQLITGTTADKLYDALEDEGLANREDVDALIEVESDDFEDMADTTFDVSNIAKEGDTVVILHYNEETSEWEYITTDTVDENLTVGGDFSSYSPVAIIVIPKEETETYTINLYTQNGDGTPFNDPVAINGPDGWSFEGDGATDDDGYQYIFGEGPDGLGVTKVDAGFVVPAGDYTVIDPSTGKQATFTVDHDGDYVAVLRAVSAELVERKLIIKDQEGNRISKAYYEIGYENGDAMGLTDDNGEAIVQLPNEQYLSICIYTSDEYGDPDEYIFFGSIEKLTEETPYEITLPDDMDYVDWF